jgi:hypothetical protein
MHSRGSASHSLILADSGALQAICQHCMNQLVALQHQQLTSSTRQDEGIKSEACRGVEYAQALSRTQAYGLQQGLWLCRVTLTPCQHRVLEIDTDSTKGRVAAADQRQMTLSAFKLEVHLSSHRRVLQDWTLP